MANGNFAGGSGIEGDPYLIEDAFDLDAVRNDLSGHYQLVNDIDLDIAPFNEGEGWVPIGGVFSGVIEGEGFHIHNLFQNRENGGLINTISNGGVRNLGIVNCNITSSANSSGALAGGTHESLGLVLIKNCFSTGVVNGTSGGNIGGLVGFFRGTIKNCWSSCEVQSSYRRVGGLVGYTTEGLISNCFSIGRVNGTDSQGGLVGQSSANNTTINSFFDIDTSEQTISSRGTGLTTQEMQTAQTFIDAGWDEELNDDGGKLWILEDGQYPKLRLANIKKCLIKSNNQYYYYDNQWMPITNTEQDYLDHGMSFNQIQQIPEQAWRSLDKPTISYYTDIDLDRATFSVETEPTSLYETFGDELEILLYSEVPNKQAQVEFDEQHSPLDDIGGDFDVVTWTDKSGDAKVDLSLKALPFDQITISRNQVEQYSDINGILSTYKLSRFGDTKFIFSFNNGRTWETYNNGWISVNISSKDDVKNKAIESYNLNWIKKNDLMARIGQDGLLIGYYLDEPKFETNVSEILTVSTNQNVADSTPQVNDLALYILNTVSTINVKFIGGNVSGQIKDADKGKVQYRMKLNGQYIFPNFGTDGFTDLKESPLDINFTIPNNLILFDENNHLSIEFRDYWGRVESWDTEFFGTYYGLIFRDPEGEKYSTNVGEVLKYLNMGTLTAGQVTDVYQVFMQNDHGYDVKNPVISSNIDHSGVTVELSKTNDPFIATRELKWNNTTLKSSESVSFYVRVATDIRAKQAIGKTFEIRVQAKRADDNESQ